MTNCPNCGAVLKSATCEYCGTVHRDLMRAEYDGPGRLVVKISREEHEAMMKAWESAKRDSSVVLFSNNVAVERL